MEKTIRSIILIHIKKGKLLKAFYTDNICFCEAAESYTRIVFSDNSNILVSKPLKEVEKILPESMFIRIHKSCLINLDHFSEMQLKESKYYVKINNTQLEISTRMRKNFLAILKTKYIII
jgi:two-component system, LytTR family, response regulator